MLKWKWNPIQIAGLILTAIGIFLIIFAVHSAHKIAEAKGFIDHLKSFFSSSNPIVSFFSGVAERKASKYDTPVLITLIFGIILTLAGPIIAIIYGTKK